MILPALAGAFAIAFLARRPSGRSGRSIADMASTAEGQQNRNRSRPRAMKATRNCAGSMGGGGGCTSGEFAGFGIHAVRTGGPIDMSAATSGPGASFRRAAGFMMVRIDDRLIPNPHRNFHPPFYGSTWRRRMSRLVSDVNIPAPIPQYP